MKIKGRTIGLIGCVTSLIFSGLFLLFGLYMMFVVDTPMYKDMFIQQGYTLSELTEVVAIIKSIFNVVCGASVIALIAGVICLVLLILIGKGKYLTQTGIIIIIVAIFHLFTARLLSSALFFISGVMILNNKSENLNTTQENSI